MKCLGVTVHYRQKEKMISDSRGLWPFKRICIGPEFFRFTERERQAILLHEVGHCKMFHLEKRILNAILRPHLIASYCQAQEYAADQFAAGCGYAEDLASAFGRLHSTGDPMHPRREDRIKRLLAWRSKE